MSGQFPVMAYHVYKDTVHPSIEGGLLRVERVQAYEHRYHDVLQHIFPIPRGNPEALQALDEALSVTN